MLSVRTSIRPKVTRYTRRHPEHSTLTALSRNSLVQKSYI